MISSFLSAAPDSAWSPISNVPPSPAYAITVISFIPCTSSPALMPEAVIAAVSNAQCSSGTPDAVYGKGPSHTAQQQAGAAIIVLRPSAFRINRIDIAAPHPGQ